MDDGTKRVIYTTSTRQCGTWSPGKTTSSLDAALAEPCGLLATRRFDRIRVDQEFIDPGAQRSVVTTILNEPGAEPKRVGIGIGMLLVLSVAMGIGMFFLTRFLFGVGFR